MVVYSSNLYLYLYLYYKDRKQLKIFLTHIGPILPPHNGPTCQVVGRWEEVKTHKNSELELVSAKYILFLSPRDFYPPGVPVRNIGLVGARARLPVEGRRRRLRA